MLGPLLWNVAYNSALAHAHSYQTIAYADDTLILVEGNDLDDLQQKAQLAADAVVGRINQLGLSVAAAKTQLILFAFKASTWKRSIHVTIGGTAVVCSNSMMYLGLTVDAHLTFETHMAATAEKVRALAKALAYLLPNTRAAGEKSRRLYQGVAVAMAFYGAEVLAEGSSSGKRKLQGALRQVALRTVSAYRKSSTRAALFLARIPPMEAWLEMGRARQRGAAQTEQKEAYLRAVDEWWLAQRPCWTRQVLPCARAWYGRKHGQLQFWLTQLLTGHGSFGEFFHRIARAPTPSSRCGAAIDSALHTVVECPRWERQRQQLHLVVRQPLESPADLGSALLQSEESWAAVSAFATRVLRTKAMEDRQDSPDLEDEANPA